MNHDFRMPVGALREGGIPVTEGFVGEELREGENTYVRIVVAAREARRINAIQRTRGISMDGKVTTEAIRRVAEGGVEWEVAPRGEPIEPLEAPEPASDPVKEEKAEE
jgi:hypothetical protein